MKEFTIYHNPRCSKSRQALALLEQNGITPRIILYLQTPPSKTELNELLTKLHLNAHAIIRAQEPEYSELNLSAASSKATLLAAIASVPKLLERPIVVADNHAVIGRPPENILQLIPKEAP